MYGVGNFFFSLPGYTSSVDRVLKRHPNFARFVSSIPVLPGGPATRQISGEGVGFSDLVAVAAGVPRSFPFHMISIQFRGRTDSE